jgi:hypothetical protein
MKNRRELGIKFHRDENSGIATIVVYDETDAMYLTSAGIEFSTYTYATIDLYIPVSGYEAFEKDFVYWITLTPEHVYTITIKKSGFTNPLSGGSKINISGYLQTEEFVDSTISGILKTYNSLYPGDLYIYSLISDSTTAVSLEKTQSFTVSGSPQSVFSLSGTNRASKFLSVSLDGGVTYLPPFDISFTWGSNSPYYNDETIDLNGYLSVLFNENIGIGETILIKYIPAVDSFLVEQSIQQPHSTDNSYTDLKAETRFLDYAFEVIPEV